MSEYCKLLWVDMNITDIWIVKLWCSLFGELFHVAPWLHVGIIHNSLGCSFYIYLQLYINAINSIITFHIKSRVQFQCKQINLNNYLYILLGLPIRPLHKHSTDTSLSDYELYLSCKCLLLFGILIFIQLTKWRVLDSIHLNSGLF